MRESLDKLSWQVSGLVVNSQWSIVNGYWRIIHR